VDTPHFYEILGVDPGATQPRIDAVFNALRDSAGSSADPDRWTHIEEAYNVLGDPEARSLYDRSLAKSGKVIGGDYHVLELLAEGSLGRTYLARDIPTGKLVVVKHCSKLNPFRQSLLRDEARKLFDLDHHAIPTVRRLIELPDGTLALVIGVPATSSALLPPNKRSVRGPCPSRTTTPSVPS